MPSQPVKPGALVLQRGKRIFISMLLWVKKQNLGKKKKSTICNHTQTLRFKTLMQSICSFLSRLTRSDLALHANCIVVSRRTSIGHLAWRGHRWCRWHHAWLRHSRIFAGVGRWVRCGAWYSGSVGYSRLGGCIRCHHDRGRLIDLVAISPCHGE